ncbi:OstA-like protein [Neolewinella lacunae]|uniref:Organic solvent tolerance-like N-terminal domain-containing protein n=1 Tax=Neolewinella lacunae TaxID=1517758 RepID=A0A923T7J3_9BACT|nr:OstA-like protein [Neolewinella lacunae]MBC6993639.1 hypothetical protein [Neolewinella lacunae]MDN3634733.1 OstA-like protein [Neolewinella lacunae]
MKKLALLTFFALLSALGTCVSAQKATPRDSVVKEVVNIDAADELRMLNRGATQLLVGNVELSQDSIFMYGDSVLLARSVQVNAYGNVTIQQGDSLAAFSDVLDYNAETRLADLIGRVVLQRGNTELYTDRLAYDLTTKLATYHTGGRIVNETTELRSTHGYYYAGEEKVYFRDSVVVVDERFEMRADTLLYDLGQDRVYFLGPTVIRTDTHRIYCEAGYYDVQLDEAVFQQNAQYLSGERRAAADTIRYFGKDEVYVLEGQAYVAEGEFQRAEAERINYFRREDRYQLEGQAFVRDSIQTVTGDTINYDARAKSYAVAGGRPRVSAPPMIIVADRLNSDPVSGYSTASGRVIWQDTSAQTTVMAAAARYNEATGYLLATGGAGPAPGQADYFGSRPLLSTVLEGDTLWMVADTLVSVREDRRDTLVTSRVVGQDTLTLGDSTFVQPRLARDTTVTTDSIRYLAAHHDVRIFKSDLQAACDSLGFNTIDSVLTLYQNPILWQDTSQLVGDTINILFRGEALDRVQLRRNALVITTPDLLFFNQVKGKQIEAFFDSTGLRRTEVTGNAEAIYYILDENQAYVGVNKTACSAMVLQFQDGTVQKIRFLSAPSGKMDPMGAVDHRALQLEGFRWETERRPASLDDLFRPLAAGSGTAPLSVPLSTGSPRPAATPEGDGG